MNFLDKYLSSVTPAMPQARSLPEPPADSSCFLVPEELSPRPYLVLEACAHICLRRPAAASYKAIGGFRLLYVRRGSLLWEQEGAHCLIGANSAVLISCDQPYTLSASEDLPECCEWFLSGPGADYYSRLLKACGRPPVSLTGQPDFDGMTKEFFSAAAHHLNNPLWQLEMMTGLLHSLIRAARHNASQALSAKLPAWLQSIHAELHDAYQLQYSLDSLEDKYRISKFRISREFTAAYGVPLITYLNIRRLEKARELLLSTDYKINVIGVMVGFDNTNHFIRLFKRRYGQTPGTYRLNHQY